MKERNITDTLVSLVEITVCCVPAGTFDTRGASVSPHTSRCGLESGARAVGVLEKTSGIYVCAVCGILLRLLPLQLHWFANGLGLIVLALKRSSLVSFCDLSVIASIPFQADHL